MYYLSLADNMFILKLIGIWNRSIALILFVENVSSGRVVSTTTGLLQGVTEETGGLQIEAFLGIPYAQPPIGHLRFKEPVPKTPWSGVLNASSLPPPCVQNASTHNYWEPAVQKMTEDCLYLNLWVPYSKESTELKTIIVFIHGGAFSHGSGSMPLYDGTNLARFGDVIVANMNYRVGVLGFFSAFIEDADGNVGIFDQILATKWIKDNAKSFGGDPDNVVLMGESAGAVILSGHLTSPLTKNLFKRVIMQSGAATFPLISEDNARLYNLSQHIASLVGCSDGQVTIRKNPRSVLECMKRIPANEIAAAEGRKIRNSKITFLPRIGDRYLPKLPIKSLQEGDFEDVDMLIGMNEEEGTLFLSAAVPEIFGHYGVNKMVHVSKKLALSMVSTMFTFTEQINEKEIAEQYINSVRNGTSDSYSKAIAMSLGDYLINCNSVFQAELYSIRNPVYFYVFSRRPSTTPLAQWMGTTHFDELQYIFGNPLFGNLTAEETVFSRRMMARWIAFAKTGNPNIPGEVTWPLFRYEDPEYLNLDDTDNVRSRPDNCRCEFWRDRYQTQISDEIISKIRRSANGGLHLTADVFCKLITIFFTFLFIRVQVRSS